ncbi:MAG: TetR/AcrR family transcriptional regulator [Desulfatibacillum sp.]|nr:TetR/AcrR family transcriptional regulator [Desulfatibacillum sp.]
MANKVHNKTTASYTKGKATRQKIITAARQVFASQPYTAASIRTIAKQGGFNHPLIHHYFPSKADLFVVVTRELYDEYLELSSTWLDGVWEMGMDESLRTSVDRIVEDVFKHPDALRTVMQNMAHGLRFTDVPGLDFFPEFWAGIQEVFRKGLSPYACKRNIAMWILAFHMVVFNCVGAPYYHAKVLGMSPTEPEYKQWVKDALMFLLYPSLKKLVFSKPGDEHPMTWPLGPPRQGRREYGSLHEQPVENLKKGEQTRIKILEAARKVFTTHPYNTASIRMIGKVGGFDFTLIHHYFPSKADLFEALATQAMEDLLPQAMFWMEDLAPLGIEDGLSVFADRAMDYCFRNPAALHGLMQNIAQIDHLDEIPGFERFSELNLTTQEAFRESTGIRRASDEDVRMFSCGLYMILYNCLGAAHFPAQVMGLDMETSEYRQWVKDFLMFLLLPVLEQMTRPRTQLP